IFNRLADFRLRVHHKRLCPHLSKLSTSPQYQQSHCIPDAQSEANRIKDSYYQYRSNDTVVDPFGGNMYKVDVINYWGLEEGRRSLHSGPGACLQTIARADRRRSATWRGS